MMVKKSTYLRNYRPRWHRPARVHVQHRAPGLYLCRSTRAKRARLYLHYGDVTDGSGLRDVIEKVQPPEICNLTEQSHVFQHNVQFLRISPTSPANSKRGSSFFAMGGR